MKNAIAICFLGFLSTIGSGQALTGSSLTVTGTNPPAAQSNNVNNWTCTFYAFQGWTGGGTMSGYPTTNCHYITHNQHAPGFSLGNPSVGAQGWSVDHVWVMYGTANSPGISQPIAVAYTKAGVGDSTTYFYHWGYGGAIATSDEGQSVLSLQGGETNHTYAGTVTTGGSGATSLVTSCTTDCGNQGDGRYLIDTQAGMANGTITAWTDPSGFVPGTFTTTGASSSVAVSTFWGTLNADIATPLPSTLGTGTTSETFAVTKVGGASAPAAGDLICFAGQFHEQVKIASVTGSGPYTITANLRHAHEKSSYIYDGGACGGFIDMTANDADPAGQYLHYPFDIIGSTGANTLVYRWFQYGTGNESFTSHKGSFALSTNAAFSLWAGAEVLDVNDGSGNVNGRFTLEPNNAAWAANDAIEEPHHYAGKYYAQFNNYFIHNRAGTYAGGVQDNFSGEGISGGAWWNWTGFAARQISNGNPASFYTGHGGVLAPPNYEEQTGLWGGQLHQYAPEGAPAFWYGCPYAGCSGVWDFLGVSYSGGNEHSILGVDASTGNPVVEAPFEYTDATHSTNHVVCWKSSTQIGACSTQPDSTGSCTCSLP